ncbi:MAG TPA: DUF72 domain-containing protein, partial [Rhodothermales bacterium]|nr:DUF72 domain-containing protein [Rhodothermales bacterium]
PLRETDVRVGSCGFRRSREAYYPLLNTVEVQHTFYDPPPVETLREWQAEAPDGFEFTLKAWQLITHHAGSPTYRRLKRTLSDREKAEAGFFRPGSTVMGAWDVTRACAKALRARAVLFQCPARFRPTPDHVDYMRHFFGTVERDGLSFCWEPRGGWPPELVVELCEELDLWHTVDPFAEPTMTPDRCYFRLHGRGGWRYKYDDGELNELREMLPEDGPSYVFFNNVEMIPDAVRFRAMVEREG